MQSMDEIYQNYAQMVYRYLYSLTKNHHLSEELTQETFYQALRSIQRFDGSCKISTWLCAIAKNQLMVYKRKNPVTEEWEISNQAVSSAEHDFLEETDRIELMKKLHGSPEPFREILYLRLFGGLSFKEIGDILGESENWARVTYYRGKERLRKELQNKDEANTM